MKFTSALTLFFFAVLSTLGLVAAAPLDVFVPSITSPKAGDVWVVGQTVEVTWDTSNAPANISNGSSVFLRKGTSTLNDLLAQGFDLRSGSISFVVPPLVPGDDYHIILFGDSGNVSPTFSIVNPPATASA